MPVRVTGDHGADTVVVRQHDPDLGTSNGYASGGNDGNGEGSLAGPNLHHVTYEAPCDIRRTEHDPVEARLERSFGALTSFAVRAWTRRKDAARGNLTLALVDRGRAGP